MIINSEHPASAGILLIREGKPLSGISTVNLTTGMATRKTPVSDRPGRSRIEIFMYQRILGDRDVIPRHLWDELELYGVELRSAEEIEKIRKGLES